MFVFWKKNYITFMEMCRHVPLLSKGLLSGGLYERIKPLLWKLNLEKVKLLPGSPYWA